MLGPTAARGAFAGGAAALKVFIGRGCSGRKSQSLGLILCKPLQPFSVNILVCISLFKYGCPGMNMGMESVVMGTGETSVHVENKCCPCSIPAVPLLV